MNLGCQYNTYTHKTNTKSFTLFTACSEDFPSCFSDSMEWNDEETKEKNKKYEAEYTQYLMGKYFSDKGLHGKSIFKKETVVDNNITKFSSFVEIAQHITPIVGSIVQVDQSGEHSEAESSTSNPPNKKKKSN